MENQNVGGIPHRVEFIGLSRRSVSEASTEAKASLNKTKSEVISNTTRSVSTSTAPQGREDVGRPHRSSAPGRIVNIGTARQLQKSAGSQLKQASNDLKEIRKAYTEAQSFGNSEAIQTLEDKASAVRQEIDKLQPAPLSGRQKTERSPSFNKRLIISNKAILTATTVKLEKNEKELNNVKTEISQLEDNIKHKKSDQKKETFISDTTASKIESGQAKRPIGKFGEDSFEKMLEADLKASKLNDEIAADTTKIEELTNKAQTLNKEIEDLKGKIQEIEARPLPSETKVHTVSTEKLATQQTVPKGPISAKIGPPTLKLPPLPIHLLKLIKPQRA